MDAFRGVLLRSTLNLRSLRRCRSAAGPAAQKPRGEGGPAIRQRRLADRFAPQTLGHLDQTEGGSAVATGVETAPPRRSAAGERAPASGRMSLPAPGPDPAPGGVPRFGKARSPDPDTTRWTRPRPRADQRASIVFDRECVRQPG